MDHRWARDAGRVLVLVLFTACSSSPATSDDDAAGAVRDIGGTVRDTGREATPADAGDRDADAAPAPDGSDAAGDDSAGDTPDGAADGPDVDRDAPDCVGVGCACSTTTASARCAGLACVDGYCCASACTAICQSCGLPGTEGTCAPIPAGDDPESECAMNTPGSCGFTGGCSGASTCARYGEETPCTDGEACSTSDRCDGMGTCRGDVPETCGPGPANVCCVGTCADEGGCATEPTACADSCSGTVLEVGATCAGCGPPGANGTCAGAARHRCDATEHTPCQALTCAGTAYLCTNAGGSWGWRTTPACDDGKACTYDDTCAAGICDGTEITCDDTVCSDLSCNGTPACTRVARPGLTCDDGDACTHSDACTGAGECGGVPLDCSDSACVNRECNGTAACFEQIRTGQECDDANACSFGDTCSALGVCQASGVVDCSGGETTCSARACNGTAECTRVARNVGGACDDGDAITTGDTCHADATCVGVAGCPPPAAACSNGSQNRRGCGNARVISRLVAGSGSGFVVSDSTCGDDNEFDEDDGWGGCFDAGGDHAYRLYMWAGESLTARIEDSWSCPADEDSFWDPTFQVFETTGCESTACTGRGYCADYAGGDTHNYTAPRDGWVVLVVDGSTAFDDEGDYRFTVRLTCRAGDCSCI